MTLKQYIEQRTGKISVCLPVDLFFFNDYIRQCVTPKNQQFGNVTTLCLFCYFMQTLFFVINQA